MLKKIRYWILISVGCFLSGLTGVTYSAENQEQNTADAWKALRSGEAVVLMRHALAPGMGDPAEFDLEQCETQRNLSNEGRTQAAAIGDVLRANGVSKATVLSSQWCRCMETAKLLNLGAPIPTPMLNSFFQNRSTEPEQTQSLHQSLKEWFVEDNDVRILVTHQVNISAITSHFTNSGDMLIVTIENGEPRLLARVSTH